MARNKEDIPLPISARRYSGKLVVQVPPEVHRNLVVEATEFGTSLDQIVRAKLG